MSCVWSVLSTYKFNVIQFTFVILGADKFTFNALTLKAYLRLTTIIIVIAFMSLSRRRETDETNYRTDLGSDRLTYSWFRCN